MRHIKLAAALVAGLSCTAVAETPKPMAFLAEARVEVDNEGKLVKVEASQDLPEGVRREIERQVGAWTFKRNHREGTSGNASTWVALGACALPKADGGYTIGLQMHGFGPRVLGHGGKWGVTRNVFRAVGMAEVNGEANVRFTVDADGHARFDEIEGLNTRARSRLEPAVEQWIEGLVFDPETIGGQPVATRESLPVHFKTVDSAPKPTKESLMANALASPECLQASAQAAGMRGVAVDSVMAIEPST